MNWVECINMGLSNKKRRTDTITYGLILLQKKILIPLSLFWSLIIKAAAEYPDILSKKQVTRSKNINTNTDLEIKIKFKK